jgi:hypothetical protein
MGGGAGGFGGTGSHGFAGGKVRHIGHLYGYQEDWMAKTKETIERELKYRGIAPEVIEEVVSKVEEPSHLMPVVVAILATALVCTLIFVGIWENTP